MSEIDSNVRKLDKICPKIGVFYFLKLIIRLVWLVKYLNFFHSRFGSVILQSNEKKKQENVTNCSFYGLTILFCLISSLFLVNNFFIEIIAIF